MKLKIAYNPYTQECQFWKDGKQMVPTDSLVETSRNRRLQTLMFPTEDWEGLAAELAEEANAKEIEVDFEGREVDYDDLKACLEEYNNSPEAISHFKVNSPVHFAANDMNLKEKLDALVDSFYDEDNPIDELRQETDLRNQYRQNMGDTFEMAVIATVSSGKSTLINAMLGQDLLPARNEPTTAKITRIFDEDSASDFHVQACRKDGTPLGEMQVATRELLERLNTQDDVFFVDMYGNVPGISNDMLRLCVLDTPGPNNSATAEHRVITRSIIEDPERQPLILYILDSTQPEVVSDAELLKEIAAQIEKRGKEAQDRFVFVMNKADEIEADKDGALEEVVRRRQAYLASKGIHSTQIIPVCAKAAKWLRMQKKGLILSQKNQKHLDSMLSSESEDDSVLENAAVLTPSCRKRLNEMKRAAQASFNAAEEAGDTQAAEDARYTLNLIKTGIVGVELTIDEYLKKYAYPQKINHATIRFRDELVEKNMVATLEKELYSNQATAKKFNGELSTIQKKQEQLTEKQNGLRNRTLGLKIDENMFEEFERTFSKKRDTLLSEVREGNEKCGPESSEKVRKEFFKTISESQKTMFQKMKDSCLRQVQTKISTDMDSLLKEYESTMRDLELTFSLTGFDMSQTAALKEVHRALEGLKVNEITYSKEKYGKSHTDPNPKPYKNPEREGFFGFFKFWIPWTLWTHEEIDDGIDTAALASTVSEQTRLAMKQMMEQLKSSANNVYEEYKNQCLEQLSSFDEAIRSQILQLESIQSKLQQNQMDHALIEKKKIWLEEKISELNSILDMNRKD